MPPKPIVPEDSVLPLLRGLCTSSIILEKKVTGLESLLVLLEEPDQDLHKFSGRLYRILLKINANLAAITDELAAQRKSQDAQSARIDRLLATLEAPMAQ